MNELKELVKFWKELEKKYRDLSASPTFAENPELHVTKVDLENMAEHTAAAREWLIKKVPGLK